MKKIIVLAIGIVAFCANIVAQKHYDEPIDSSATVNKTAWKAIKPGLHFTWVNNDVHYLRHDVPKIKAQADTVIYAWRGERVGVRGLLYSKSSVGKPLSIVVKPIDNKNDLAPQSSWLRYVLTDSFSTCGQHPTNLKPYTVAEILDPYAPLSLKANEVRPFWVSIEVPRQLPAGEYAFKVSLSGAKAADLNLKVVVIDRQLPAPHDYKFHLNIWQQPYSVSRFYGVEPWSEEHFNLLRPYMKELARLGQKVVSAILFYEPWGEQSNDKFEPMIATTRCADGSWAYDYSVFDRWVEFMAECGIDEQIDCYSMVPWDMTFRYWDEKEGAYQTLKTKTNTPEYCDLWTNYLVSFAKHLREKGWFEKTCIAMDERGLEDMLRAHNIAQKAVPGIKMTLAGNYHKELGYLLHDYSIAFGQSYSKGEVKMRRELGSHSTYYTCCTDAHPGLFSNSNPVDAAMLGVYCAAADFDGWLHWSWLNWTDNPLQDSRFKLFAPGDTYFFYPGPRSSLRHERLLEGIQIFEKLQIVNTPEIKEVLNEANEAKLHSTEQLVSIIDRLKRLLNETK